MHWLMGWPACPHPATPADGAAAAQGAGHRTPARRRQWRGGRPQAVQVWGSGQQRLVVCLVTQHRQTCLWALLALLPAEATDHVCARPFVPPSPLPRSFADLFRAIRVEDFSSYISKVGWAGWEVQLGFGCMAGCACVWWSRKHAATGAGQWSAEWIAAPGVLSGADRHGSATPAAPQLTTPRELMLFMTGEQLQLMMWRQMAGEAGSCRLRCTAPHA